MTTTGSMTLIGQGFRRASTKWGVLGVLYAVNLLITIPLALVFRSSLATIVGDMPAIDQLFSGYNYTVYNDLSRIHADAITVFTRMFVPLAIASLIVHAIMGVGLVRVMEADGAVREFFGGIVSFGLRAARLFLVFVLFGAILLVLAGFLSTMIYSLVTEGNATEDAYMVALILSGLVFAIALSITILGAEYARILTVRENRTSMMKSGWNGLVMVVRHPIRMIMLHGSVFLSLVAAVLLYWIIEGVVEMTSVIGVIVMFVIQQLFVLYRILTRVWNTANGVGFSAVIASATRPSFVKAPSVHDRRTPYREPLEKDAERSAEAPRTGQGSRGGGRRDSQQPGRGDRPGYKSRGRRRGGGRPQSGSASGSSPKPDAKPPSSGGTPKPEGPPKTGKPRRRRRPPRRPPSGNA